MKNKNPGKAKNLIKVCLNRQKKLIFLNCILSSLISVAYIILALLSKQLLDIATGHSDGKFYTYVIFIAVTVILQLLLNAAFSHFQTAVSGKMSIFLHKTIFNWLFQKRYDRISSYHSGELLNRFTSDCDVVVNNCTNLLPSLFATAAKLISGIAALLIIDWRFGGGIVIISIFIPLVAKLLTAKYKKLHRLYQASTDAIKAFFSETLLNMPVIKSFASLKKIDSVFQNGLSKNYSLKIKRNWLNIFTSSSMYLFFTAGYFLILLWGTKGIKSGTVTYGSLIAFLQIISQLRAPMQNISAFLPQYSTMLASAERISEIEDFEDELLPLDKNTLDAVKDVFPFIKAENLNFSYGSKAVLNNCSFYIERGNIAVITGESGIGKSTLFKLLLGFLEKDSGTLTLGEKYDINASTRALFSYVPQGNMVLSGTIKENLTICTNSTDKGKIEAAVETAVLKEWIDTLPDGLDTKIGENGLGISEGQAQRIAIARALICDTPILLLDEATCSLDAETEHKLLWNLKDLPDKTVLFVTHRKVEDGIADVTLHLENNKFI